MLMEVTINACQTTWGWVGMAASTAGVLRIILPVSSREGALAAVQRDWPGAQEGMNSHLATLHPKLERYFRGEDVSFQHEALDMQKASAFLVHVWSVVREIPRGQVRAYGWVAQQVGSPHGARAVGLATATNPFPLIVPCHRVVGKHGQLTGFGGGLEMKSRLLAMEGAHVRTE
jgi:methylated-DNA-[protein]-cysteine S-methyltransferase